MNTPIEYLDAVKSYLKLPSDYAASGVLDISRAAVSRIRASGGGFDNVTAVRIARILNISPLEVIAAAEYHRAHTDELRAIWQELWEKNGAGSRVQAEQLRGWSVGVGKHKGYPAPEPVYPHSY